MYFDLYFTHEHPRPHWGVMLACPSYWADKRHRVRVSQKTWALDFFRNHSFHDVAGKLFYIVEFEES